jgi:hypothetical protein
MPQRVLLFHALPPGVVASNHQQLLGDADMSPGVPGLPDMQLVMAAQGSQPSHQQQQPEEDMEQQQQLMTPHDRLGGPSCSPPDAARTMAVAGTSRVAGPTPLAAAAGAANCRAAHEATCMLLAEAGTSQAAAAAAPPALPPVSPAIGLPNTGAAAGAAVDGQLGGALVGGIPQLQPNPAVTPQGAAGSSGQGFRDARIYITRLLNDVQVRHGGWAGLAGRYSYTLC